MKKILILVFALLFCLGLGACAKTGEDGKKRRKDEELALDIRAEYIAAGQISMTMYLTADYGERVYEYKLQFSANGSGGEILVLEPEIINGLTVLLSSDASILKFDGAELSTGTLYGAGNSPLEAASGFLGAWRSGYISQCYTEKLGDNQALVMVTSFTDTAVLSTWFDRDTHLPLKAEITQDGFTVIRCSFEAVSLR